MAARPAVPLAVAHDAEWREDNSLETDMRAIKDALGRVEAERDTEFASQQRAERSAGQGAG